MAKQTGENSSTDHAIKAPGLDASIPSPQIEYRGVSITFPPGSSALRLLTADRALDHFRALAVVKSWQTGCPVTQPWLVL